jgi:hypothetical protein
LDLFANHPSLVFGTTQDKPNRNLARYAAFGDLIAVCPKTFPKEAACPSAAVTTFLLAFECHFQHRIDAALRNQPPHLLWGVEKIQNALSALLAAGIKVRSRNIRTNADQSRPLTPLFCDAIKSLQTSAPDEEMLFKLHIGRICLLIALTSGDNALRGNAS